MYVIIHSEFKKIRKFKIISVGFISILLSILIATIQIKSVGSGVI